MTTTISPAVAESQLRPPKNLETATLLADVNPGPDRFWRVELIKNVSTKPIKVSLMQSQIPGRTALSECIGFTRTIATPAKVREAAELVLVQVGGYAKVIGEYLGSER